MNLRGKNLSLCGALCLGVCMQPAVAAEDPKWDQAAYQGMAKSAQQQYGRDYKAAMELAHPPQAFQSKTRAVSRKSGLESRAVAGATDIQYDDGVLTAVPAVSSLSFGNRFDTADGSPIADSATLSQVQFFIAPGAGTDNVFISAFNYVTGTTASVIASVSVPLNNGSSTFNTIPAATLGITNAFSAAGTQNLLVGVWYIAGDTVGLGSGTTGGQGYHGFAINDIAATGYTPLTNLNALIRLQGSNLPVELIEFTVD